MDGLIQVCLIISFLFLYALTAAVPLVLLMAVITYRKQDKTYFRKKIDKLIGGNNG